MAEIRFPRRGRSERRGAREDAPSDPLEEMAVQIRALDAAAERAASRIAEAAADLSQSEAAVKSATGADLLAGLASALVDRTDEIRSECGRLSALMDRTAQLIAGHPEPPVVSQPPPVAVRPEPPVAVEPEPSARFAPEAEFEPAAELADLEPEPEFPAAEQFDQAADEPFDRPADDLFEGPGAELLDQPDDLAAEPEAEPTGGLGRPRWLARRESEVPPAGTSEGVRLIATQMAIAGSSRSEIERRLRIQFGVRDADLALDEIFGHRSSGVG